MQNPVLTYANQQGRAKTFAFMLIAVLLLSVLATVFLPGVGPAIANAAGETTTTTAGTGSVFDGMIRDDGTVVVTGGAQATANGGTGFSSIIQKYKTVCTFILSIVTITMIIFLIIQFTKLGAAGDNQNARKSAIGGILTTGIATALLGSLTIWFGFFYNVLKEGN